MARRIRVRLAQFAALTMVCACGDDAGSTGPVDAATEVEAATELAFTVQPSNTTAENSNPPVEVTVRDRFGNAATAFSGQVTVALGTDPSGGTATLSGTVTVTAASGVTTFSDLSVDVVGTGYTLTATATGLTAATSNAFDINEAVCVAPPADLIAWWPLDETSGTIAGDIIGGNDGTHTGGPTPVTGKAAGALSFDGSDDYLFIPASVSTSIPVPWTIDAWVLPIGPDLPVGRCLADDYHIFGNGDVGPLLIQDQFCQWEFLSVTEVVVDFNVWSHIAGVGDGTIARLYLNGNLIGSEPSGLGISGDIFIGTRDGTQEFFNGLIDEVGLYDRALSQTEIQAIFDAGSAAKCKT